MFFKESPNDLNPLTLTVILCRPVTVNQLPLLTAVTHPSKIEQVLKTQVTVHKLQVWKVNHKPLVFFSPFALYLFSQDFFFRFVPPYWC